MPLARDLLEQAEFLAKKEPRRPKQASLRRAISTAYYALFHLLIDDAAKALSPSTPSSLHKIVARVYQHGQIKSCCRDFVDANKAKANNRPTALPAEVEALLQFPLDRNLIDFLEAFVELQEARHKADYDLFGQFNRLDVLTELSLAHAAFDAWWKVRKSESAYVFMTSLLIRRDWKR